MSVNVSNLGNDFYLATHAACRNVVFKDSKGQAIPNIDVEEVAFPVGHDRRLMIHIGDRTASSFTHLLEPRTVGYSPELPNATPYGVLPCSRPYGVIYPP
jgi:hypothetical protein